MNESGGAAAGELEAAEQLIMRWHSAAAPEEDRMLFDGADHSEAKRYLRAVDELRRSVRDPATAAVGSPRRSSAQSPPGPSGCKRESTGYDLLPPEIDLLPPDAIRDDAIHDLRSIAEQMIGTGYGRECYQAYGSPRKAAVDACSIDDVPSL